jgi:hypothetical protein
VRAHAAAVKMLDTLRKPLFLVAMALMLVALLIELGSVIVPDKPPGYGIAYMAALDGLVFYTVLLMGLSLLIPERIHGKAQGCATLLISFFACVGIIAMIFMAVGLLILMVTLLISPIFGTIAYFAIFGHFATTESRIVLASLMTLKLGFAVCLVFAHQRFLQNKGLVLIVLCSLLANIIISFLHGFVPGFLVSITDIIAALVIAIIALIWAIVFLIGALISIIKAVT